MPLRIELENPYDKSSRNTGTLYPGGVDDSIRGYNSDGEEIMSCLICAEDDSESIVVMMTKSKELAPGLLFPPSRELVGFELSNCPTFITLKPGESFDIGVAKKPGDIPTTIRVTHV